MKKVFSFIWELLKVVAVTAIIVIPIRYFLFQPFLVRGQSMEPNFENSDYLIVDEITYRFRNPQRGEVIVFRYPENPSQRFIKRIIGLPGETIEVKDGRIIVYEGGDPQNLNESNYIPDYVPTLGEVRIVLEEEEYFVLGDNRTSSFDSRKFGALPRGDIIGRAVLRVWPFPTFTKIVAPTY